MPHRLNLFAILTAGLRTGITEERKKKEMWGVRKCERLLWLNVYKPHLFSEKTFFGGPKIEWASGIEMVLIEFTECFTKVQFTNILDSD